MRTRLLVLLTLLAPACDKASEPESESGEESSSDDGDARAQARAEQVAMIIDRCNDVLFCLVECENEGDWPHPDDPACRVECAEPADEQCPTDDDGDQWCQSVLDVVDEVIDDCRAGMPCSCYQGSDWDDLPD